MKPLHFLLYFHLWATELISVEASVLPAPPLPTRGSDLPETSGKMCHVIHTQESFGLSSSQDVQRAGYTKRRNRARKRTYPTPLSLGAHTNRKKSNKKTKYCCDVM